VGCLRYGMSDIDATVCWVWLWWIFFFRVEQGELLQFLPKRDTLAQARYTRPSEIHRVSSLVLFRWCHPGDQVWGLSDTFSRSGEIGSPKRGREETWTN